MSNTTNTSSNGLSFMRLLGIVFIVLKLCNVITWSWWWVTAPLWGGLALAIILSFARLLVGIFSYIIKKKIVNKVFNALR